jgi:hypothetical protein
VRYTGLYHTRNIVFPLPENEAKIIKEIETKIENNNLIISFFVGEVKRIFEIPQVKR